MKNILKRFNPFKEQADSTKGEFVVQKILAFILIYIISELIMEPIIIVAFSLAGYDVIHGVMPEGSFVGRIPLYGMGGFAVITYLYVRIVEKRNLSSLGIKFNIKSVLGLFKGLIVGAALIVIAVGILMAAGIADYEGIGSISAKNAIFWFLAYFVQSFTEEFMCRGFIQTSLNRRVSIGISVFISGLAFIVPHLSSLEGMGITEKVIGVVNLILVSCLFSAVVIKCKSLGFACGLHAGWNYCLGIVFGLVVTGGDTTDAIINMNVKNGYDIITGGSYGIESGIVIIPLLALSTYVCMRLIKKERVADGIQ